MPDDEELKLTRRLFLLQTAIATAATATWYSVAMKTDALAQGGGGPDPGGHNVLPYQYS